jgi:hypothetical protein
MGPHDRSIAQLGRLATQCARVKRVDPRLDNAAGWASEYKIPEKYKGYGLAAISSEASKDA